jgi:hypothetical protein
MDREMVEKPGSSLADLRIIGTPVRIFDYQ